MRCIQPSQRCISSRQMTDNIFEIETTALAHVACAPQDSDVFLTDFAAAYPSVTHSWFFSVLENTGLPDFLCRFLRSIYRDSITHVEFAGAERGAILYGQRSATRLSCEWFPFCNGLQSIIPRNLDNMEFLKPAQCAYADDLTVASLSFRGLMTGTSISLCGFHCWPQFELPQMFLGSFWHRGTRFSADMDLGELRRVP